MFYKPNSYMVASKGGLGLTSFYNCQSATAEPLLGSQIKTAMQFLLNSCPWSACGRFIEFFLFFFVGWFGMSG